MYYLRKIFYADGYMKLNNENVVEATNLTKCFGSNEAVRGIDFTVRQGECFGFLGPNGAGKTTTMSMMYCFLPPTSGDLKIFGYSVGKNDKKIKELIGVVPQEDSLDPELSVMENLIVYARYFNIKKHDATERVNKLLSFMHLQERSDDKVQFLSGGMKRRLVIARALINRPKLIILDEPTTGLDPQARHVIWNKLIELKKEGVTLILSTHYMEEAHSLCDRLVIMDNGNFVAKGKPENLIKENLEKEVVEILSRGGLDFNIADFLKGLVYRYEKSGHREYLFSEDGDSIVKKLLDLGPVELLQRKTTLEDLFLKMTGKELDEQ